MTACSTDKNLLRTPSSKATPACRIYPLSYEALQRFTQALSNLARSRSRDLKSPLNNTTTDTRIVTAIVISRTTKQIVIATYRRN